MADFIVFTEGRNELAANGLPSTCYFLLSSKSVDGTSAFTAGNSLAAVTVGEIAGTGYTRKTESEPSPASGVVSFSQQSWSTASATDWPSAVRSIILVTSSDNSGKAICAWNLQTGGAGRDLSQANTTENVTPTLTIGS